MNTRLVSSAADVILRALTQNRTAAGIALALESAQLLQSPETVAEHEHYRAAFEAQQSRAETLDGLLRTAQDRVAELEKRITRARDLHVKYDDSEHCQFDGEIWPCLTVNALAEPKAAEDRPGMRHAVRTEDDDPARCLKVHPFSPRDGWRMVCGNCDHGKDASCHRDGDR